MYLSSLKVQHYKSLDNVSVDFAPGVTVIVGPNGVGKSNFVDVLRFLHDAVVDDLEHAITKREGIGRLLQSYKTKPYKIGINTVFLSDASEALGVGHYNLRLKAVGKNNYMVESEDATYIPLSNTADESEPFLFGPNSRTGVSSDSLVLGSTGKADNEVTPFGGVIAQHISGWNYCTIYPNTLKKPALPDRDNALKESGENWASVIKALKRSPKGREALDRIYDAMRAVLPTFVEVSIQTVGSYLVPLFKFRTEDESSLTSFDPVQLSDGTLRLFGILLAAYQLPRPKLLVIEEPEQTIYPGALAVLADVFKEIGKSTQVLITTHSPHLVQFFKPSQIRVATMHDGMTQIRPIHPHQMEAVNEGLLSLEEFMTTEGLRPDDTAQESS
jgi:predicted ATPase